MKRERVMYPPEIIKLCLYEVMVKDKPIETVARENGVKFWTLYRWLQRAQKEGLENTYLLAHTKRELVDMVLRLRTDNIKERWSRPVPEELNPQDN